MLFSDKSSTIFLWYLAVPEAIAVMLERMNIYMVFRKLSAPSLKELFITELENMILSGKLAIGDKLPPERELADSMQVSRAVVNSGIAEMEKKGFLVVKPRIGTFVADYHKYGTTDTLAAIMRYNGGTLHNTEVRSILEIRQIFMTLACSLAIDNASDEEISQLYTYIEQLSRCTDQEEAARLCFDFSHEIAYISGNVLLPAFFISFRDLVTSLWVRYAARYGILELHRNNSEIYQYLISRNKEGVVAYLAQSTLDTTDGPHTIYSV